MNSLESVPLLDVVNEGIHAFQIACSLDADAMAVFAVIDRT